MLNRWQTSSGITIYQVLRRPSNSFLITNGTCSILADSGRTFQWKQLKARLQGLNINQIDLLVLTHTHHDHASNASRIKEKYNAKILLHESETEYLLNGDSPIPKGSIVLTKVVVNLFAGLYRPLVKYPPAQFDQTVSNTYNLTPCGINAFIIHTPGHSKGSVTIVIDNEIAIAGDTLYGAIDNSAFPPFADDVFALMGSWEKLLATGCHTFLPMHGGTISRELLSKEYEKYRSKLSSKNKMVKSPYCQ